MKIKWIIDQYGRTPLHYLLGSSLTEDKTNYTSVNRIFDYILDFLEDNLKNNTLTFYDTMKSLSNISTFMFAKCQPESLHRYLQMAFSTPTMLNKELPKFGIPVRKIRLEKEPILSEEGLEDIYKQGSQTVKFRMVLLYYDFNPLSEDMLSLILVLSKLVDQNFFKTRAISTLVDYLWRANLKYNYAIALCFSILMILASIDLCIETPPLALQIVILVLDFLFILHECLQISCHGLKYFKSVWNYFDLGFYIMLIIAIILQLAHSEDSLAQGWIFTFVFLIGFGRWISYLRLFDLSSINSLCLVTSRKPD